MTAKTANYTVKANDDKTTITLESGETYVLDTQAWEKLAQPAIKGGADPEQVLGLMATLTSKSAKKVDPVKKAIEDFNAEMERRAEKFGHCPAVESHNLEIALSELSGSDLEVYATGETWRFKVSGRIASALQAAKDADEVEKAAAIEEYRRKMLAGVDVPRDENGNELPVVWQPGEIPHIKVRRHSSGKRRRSSSNGKRRRYVYLGEEYSSLVEVGKAMPGAEEGKSRGYYYSRGLKALEDGTATVAED